MKDSSQTSVRIRGAVSLLLAAGAVLALCHNPQRVCLASERVQFRNGRSLIIEGHELVEETVVLLLSGNGRIEVNKSWIEGISSEEAVAETSRQDVAPHADCQSTQYSLEEIRSLVRESARKFQVDEKLLTSMIQAESDFNPLAVSPKGASGLMQLMPETAIALKVENIFDARENVEAGARYIQSLLRQFKDNLALALAAYNAGPSAVLAYGGIPPFPETQQYVLKVLSLNGRVN